jgi:hypothetical protein
MKKILLVALLLSACKHTDTGTGITIPPVPVQLSQRAESLPPNNDATFAGQIRDNNNNIRAYNKVASEKNALLDLYNCVRESINNRREPKCL